jgi:hypothetical protein
LVKRRQDQSTLYGTWCSLANLPYPPSIYYLQPCLPAMVADPYHFNAVPDPDPAFHCEDTKPDPTFHFNADPDPVSAPHHGCESASICLQVLHGSILSLHASIHVYIHCPPWRHFEPLKLLNFLLLCGFEFRFFTLMRIRIRLKLSRIIRIRIRNPTAASVLFLLNDRRVKPRNYSTTS